MTDEKDNKALRDFFSRHITPLATPAHMAHSANSVPSAAGSDSYFVKRHSSFMSADEFEISLRDRGEFASALADHWQGTRFVSLAPALLEFGRRFEKIESKDDVSSFVYEMF